MAVLRAGVPDANGVDLCGESWQRPSPVVTAAVAWAVSPDDGPIFGQRIERFASADDVSRLIGRELALPCEHSRDGGRWRTEEVESEELGDGTPVLLVTSLDRPDNFNDQVIIASGDVALLAVLNARTPDRALLDELIAIAWEKAVAEGVVG